MTYNISDIRKDFPILHQEINKKPLVYFDNGATTHKPQEVIDAISDYYSKYNSNIHRGVHHLSQIATNAFEESRDYIKNFINAPSREEVIFTRGTTEAINLLAHSFGKAFVHEGDEVIVSEMEHHSNIVPWQILCEDKKAKLKVIPIDDNGELLLEELDKIISPKTKIIAITHISNALGTINPIKKIIEKAHQHNIPVLIDGAQAVAHEKVDVQVLDCDFYTFSAHKIYGPMGIGVLYGKKEWLDKMPPYQGGGEMISNVSFEKTTYNELPYKFEAGTPSVADAIAFKTALEYLQKIGIENIKTHENTLLDYATSELLKLDNIKIYGTAKNKAALISFLIQNIHPYDVGTMLDQMGIAVRTGHHCAQTVMDRYQIPGTIRASFAMYNTKEEIDVFIAAIKKVQEIFS
jgi:cysteine desulfurase / selenocysteine lyase